LITTILAVSYSSAHAQTLTPNLVFSTYLGGAAGSKPLTFAQNTACDALGNIYVTGATQVVDLPVLNAYQPTPAPDSAMSAFVAKYNPAGQPLWCTYLGGNNQSMGVGVAATPTGGVAVVGITTSDGSGSFPTTQNAFQSQYKGQSDYFVSVFNANGQLQYSTYLGGSGVEGGAGVGPNGQIIFNDDSNNGNCVAVDANGLVYVGGMTTSGGGSGASKFPVTPNALQSNLAGSRNASLCILDPSRSGAASLVYSSFLGGDRDNQGHSVAVDPSGRYIAVGGFTTSSNFPTTINAYRDKAPHGGFGPNSSNGFVTQFHSSQPGSSSSQYTMRYSTYLGGDSSSARDDVYGMTMTASGLIVATGRTQSSGFPMTTGGATIFNSAPYLKEGKSGDEPYLVKINPSLNGAASLVYSTFLGGGSASGQWGSWSTSVAVDAQGAVYVGGETDAQGATYDPTTQSAPQAFPYTSNAFLKAPQGSEDALLMQINPSGDFLDYSTYLGGKLSDRTYGLSVDPDGNVVLTGLTFSSNFPLQNPAQTWPGNTNYQNAFVTKFSPLYAPSNLIIDHGATYPVTGDLTYDNESIGQHNTGALIQGGFTNTVNNNLKLGQNAGASGSYNLSGGSLWVGGYEYVGYSGAGSFTQSGGSHTVTALYLGTHAGACGSYNLTDPGSGSHLKVAGNVYIGYSGAGCFTQTGGSHTVGSNLFLGAQGGTGSYSLSGGSLSVGGNEYVGNSGSGAFTQTGGTHTVTGILFLAANSGGSGTYNLNGGSFIGNLVNSGLLSGIGPIIGAVTNSGIVSPGNSPGVLSVVGAYTQAAAGSYKAEMASASSYDQLNVTGAPGTASLAGAILPTLLNGYRPRGNQVFPGVLTATGGITGAFTTIANQQISPTLFWQARYNPTSVDLWVQRHYTNAGLGLNANQQGVGAMLNRVAGRTSGDLDEILNTIDYLPNGASVRDAYKQISPEKSCALATLAFAGAGLQQRTLSQRLTNLRFAGREAGVAGGRPGAFNLNCSQAQGLMLAFNSSNLSTLITGQRQAPPSPNPWGLYLDPALILGGQKSSVNQTGYNFTIAGLNAGADFRVRDDLVVGLATGYSHTTANFSGSGGGVQTNTWPLTAYAAYLPSSFYAYGSLGYGLNLFNLERNFNFGGLNRTAKSSPVGHQLNAYTEAGYDLNPGSLVVTPVASLAYSGLWVSSFSESGAGALNLKVSPQSAASLQTGVGGRIAAPLQRGPVVVAPQAYATYQHEFAKGSRGLDARLSQGGSAFIFQTDAAKKNFAVVGASVTISAQKKFGLQINYNAEVGRANYTAHYVNAGLRWEF